MNRILRFMLILLFLLLTIGCIKDEVKPIEERAATSETDVTSEEHPELTPESEDDGNGIDEKQEQELNQSDGTKESKDSGVNEIEDSSGKDNEKKPSNQKEQTAGNNFSKSGAGTTEGSSVNKEKNTTTKNEKQTEQSKQTKKQADTAKETPKEKPKEETEEKQKEEPKQPKKTVTVSITTGDVKGVILPATKVSVEDGDTALDVTIRILKEKGIQYSVRGANSTAYVEGIDNLYEFDEGFYSGWHVRVNGGLIDRSAGAYPVEEGHTVNWNYTVNYLEETNEGN
ncbi:DUF4430 domain-containing protein [Virgibacillus sp. C22-A2]|uniref:DUF4430 domain-containing protein n=2 Tax=Virgibacillus tibetensis TaxID=3042313 RepID=A0ABU6KCM4_9BACI|nr:DUF4430 domain-containing protein [Virgibacillus sp. C22-A2]